jgi:hypothetical protein
MVMITISSNAGGPHVKWTIPQDAQIKLLPKTGSCFHKTSEAYQRLVRATAEQPIFKNMNIPPFKLHNRAKHLNFNKPKADAKSKLLLSKKAEQYQTRFDAAVEAKVTKKLASTLATPAGPGSANNAIAINLT